MTPLLLVLLLATANLATAIAYAVDKRQARRGGRRIPEARLHALELLGGWPAALAMQWAIRHKNRKLPYQAAFWAIVALHGTLAWAWLRR